MKFCSRALAHIPKFTSLGHVPHNGRNPGSCPELPTSHTPRAPLSPLLQPVSFPKPEPGALLPECHLSCFSQSSDSQLFVGISLSLMPGSQGCSQVLWDKPGMCAQHHGSHRGLGITRSKTCHPLCGGVTVETSVCRCWGL